MLKNFLIAIAILFSANVYAADYLDTQYGDDGLEVHIMKTKVNNGVLTVVFAMQNPGSEKIEVPSMPAAQVFFNTADKKFPVLKDAEDKWLASTILYNRYTKSTNRIFTGREDGDTDHTLILEPGKKKVGWVKFEAPQDSDWPVDLNFPGVTPFTLEKPQ